MKSISLERFNAFAAYARHSAALFSGTEIGWFEDTQNNVIATLLRGIDDDFLAIILAPDSKNRFRQIDMTASYSNPAGAIKGLYEKILEITSHGEVVHSQGDERGKPVDFFAPVGKLKQLHSGFIQLRDHPGDGAARDIITAMMRWHEDVDGNFIEQFQTTGFNARIWELYLFATLSEAGLLVERPSPAPDFIAKGLSGSFALEATTINPAEERGGAQAPSQRPGPREDPTDYLQEYLPFRYAKALVAKLDKQYWMRFPSQGLPLVFAVQDFYDTLSMTYGPKVLPEYLYGYRYSSARDPDGSIRVIPHKILEHVWEAKQVPSGFFDLNEAENISAVICNSMGTIAKFNRMGVGAGFGADEIVMVQQGTAFDPDPRASQARRFDRVVREGHDETWIEGMDVYHNPRALHPLDPDFLPGAAHHWLSPSHEIESLLPAWKPRESTTSVLRFYSLGQSEIVVDQASDLGSHRG